MAKKRTGAGRARKSGAGSRRTKSRAATRRGGRVRRARRLKPATPARRSKASTRKAKTRRAVRPPARRPSKARPARPTKARSVKAPKVAKAKAQVRAPKRVQRATEARSAAPLRQPRLERDRRLLPDTERLNAVMDLSGDRLIAAARSGHDEMRAERQRHTEASPTLTAGDVDARWQDAYAIGDEAPGGDNPTPDQDRVDDIGRALGVQYQDNEELKGGIL